MSRRPAPRHPARRPDEAAVSSVLGAVLVFGLLVVTLAVVQVEFVPVWEEEREARHSDQVASQLAQVASDLQRLGSNQSFATVTDPVTLTRGGVFTFFGGGVDTGAGVAFTPDSSSGLALSSPLMRLRSVNGALLYGLDDSWLNYDNATSNVRENVTSMDFLRLRVTNFTKIQTQDVFSAELRVTSGGVTHARFFTIVTRSSSETSITVRVLDRNGTAVHESAESFFNNAPLNSTYVNALSEDYLFAALLSRAPAPYTVTFSTDAPPGIFDAQYLFSGTQASAGGSQVIGTLGLPVANYTTSLRSGSLAVEVRHQRIPSQTFVVEHGAVLLLQGGSAVVRVPPALRLATAGTQTQLTWTLPGLTGVSSGVSGSDSASLTLAPDGGRSDLVGSAATLLLQIPTQYPAAWTAWLDAQLRGAGLSTAMGHYTLTNTTSRVTLALSGASSAADEDIFLSLQQTNVQVIARPSG